MIKTKFEGSGDGKEIDQLAEDGVLKRKKVMEKERVRLWVYEDNCLTVPG